MHQASYSEIVGALRAAARGDVPEPTARRAAQELALLAEVDILPAGRRLIEEGLLRRDESAIRRVMRERVEIHPAVRPLAEGQWGLELTREQVTDVLAYAYPESRSWTGPDLTRFLETLSSVGIVAFNRRRPTVRVLTGAPEVAKLSGNSALISPKTPYRNKRLLVALLEGATRCLWWFDPHLTRGALAFLYEEAPLHRLREIRLLSVGRADASPAAKDDYRRIRTELGDRDIALEWRSIVDVRLANETHDRWLRVDDRWWNVPPFSAIMTGKFASLVEDASEPPFDEWWLDGSDLASL